VIQEKNGDTIHYDFTQWTSVANLKNMNYSVKTYQDQSIRSIDVKKALDAAKGEVKVIKLLSEQAIDDISTNF
jgi:choloylglycine hydrolase